MPTLPITAFSRKSAFALLFAFLTFVASLFAQASVQRSRAGAPQNCGSGFAGSWRSSTDSNSVWNITVTGNSGQGDYRAMGQARRILKGIVTDTLWRGEWYEESFDRARSGIFVANLVPPERRIRVTFYVKNTQLDAADWTCGSAPTPPPSTPDPTATATPIPTPSAASIREDHDTDNFQTFDSLEPAEQKKVLIRRGPRMPIEYSANDLSMRVLARSGWPVALDYGLTSADFATLTIQIPGLKPDQIRLEPGGRLQIRRNLRDWRNGDVRVAKIRIETSSPDGNFRLYGFGMGEHAAQAWRSPADVSRFLLAMNYAGRNFDSDSPSLPLLPQLGTSVGITVSLPASLRLGQSPKERIEFSYVSNSDFSDGRWEWWRVTGTTWKKVWQKGTGGISRNQSKSQTWDGIITSARQDSIGFHSLSISVWQKADEPEWVAARTDPALEVIR